MSALKSDLLRLIIFGEQKDRLNLISMVTGLGLSEQVIFSGPYDSEDAILSGADLFLHSSGEEGMSTDLLDALGAGIGVIAMETPEMKEILVHPECLLPKNNVGECAVHLASFVNNRDTLKNCKKRSQERACAYNFDWAKKTIELVLESRRRRRRGKLVEQVVATQSSE